MHLSMLQVAKIWLHPNFNATDLASDMAIITLSNHADLNNYVRPVCLWNTSATELSEVIGKNGTVVGWGTTENGTTSNVLQQASMPVVDSMECLASNIGYYGAYLSKTSFCAGLRNGWSDSNTKLIGIFLFLILFVGTSACQGEENGLHYIRGVISQTESKENKTTQQLLCNSRQYLILTDVAQYLPWIDSVLNKNCKKEVQCNSEM